MTASARAILRVVRTTSLLSFLVIALRQRHFFLEGLRRLDPAVGRVEAEQVPRLGLVAALADVPAVVLVAQQREEGADGGLVAVLVAFLGAELVQDTAVVEEDAPAVHD